MLAQDTYLQEELHFEERSGRRSAYSQSEEKEEVQKGEDCREEKEMQLISLLII
jgi:hypothetical protein